MEEEKNLISTEAEEKKPNFLKPIIIAVCVLAAFTCFYFGMQYFAGNKPTELSIGEGATPSAGTQSETPAVTTPSTVSPSPSTAPIPTLAPTAPPKTETYTETPTLETSMTFEESMNKCQEVATKHLGAGAMILPDFDAALIEVTFDGKTRPCYVFVGGDLAYVSEYANGTATAEEAPARYVVDITNGDVFDTISKNYIK